MAGARTTTKEAVRQRSRKLPPPMQIQWTCLLQVSSNPLTATSSGKESGMPRTR